LNQTKLSKTQGIACWLEIFAGRIDTPDRRPKAAGESS
jgi:hypothetical protein